MVMFKTLVVTNVALLMSNVSEEQKEGIKKGGEEEGGEEGEI